jgi:putative peptide modification system cyclase
MQRQPGTALDRAVASEIAVRDGARAVILPTVAEVGGRVRVSAEVIDPQSQTTVYAEYADGSGLGSVLASVDAVTAALRARLGEEIKAIERDSEPLPQVTTSNLDALRAYALGQRAFGRSQYGDAKAFYARAVDLDPDFALAYVGLVRAHNGLADLENGIGFLRKAQALQDRLPPRDRLYVEAWIAQVDTPDAALGKWRHMADLYPDFFPAVANVGNAHYMRHEYKAALPYAHRTATSRNEFNRLAHDLVGRLQMGMGELDAAEEGFSIAAKNGMGSAQVRLSATHAARRDFARAESAWPDEATLGTVYFERLSMLVDQGSWRAARKELGSFSARLKPGSSRRRASRVAAAAALYAMGDWQGARKELDAAKEANLDALARPTDQLTARDDRYAVAVGGLLAQRMGDLDHSSQALQELKARESEIDAPPMKQLLATLQANQLRLEGDAKAAIELLEPLQDGNEPFQVHAALLEAYAASGDVRSALEQARWLSENRGMAYAENGCSWCEQPMNVYDTTASYLRAAEILASVGRPEARKEIAKFDRHWPTGRLPPYLRVRREAVVATFN